MASGTIVNVRRDVEDKFYRYRMPLLMTKIEGKGNGIKTVIPNMSDVARALSRPPAYPTKFFGCELGAQTSSDEKNDRYIVNGAHQADRMRELLDGFIDKFVLCKACKNPETELIITKTEEIIRDCKACGQRTGVDMRHKLTTFIIKNPPKRNKRSKGNTAEAAGTPTGEDGSGGDEEDDELSRRLKAEAAELNAESTLAKEDWSQDTSEEAVKARIAKMGAALGRVGLGGDDSEGEGEDSPYGQLGVWLAANRDAGAAAVYKQAEDLGIAKKHKTLQVIAQHLFTENIVEEIPKYAPVFAKMVTSEKHQKSLLGGLEHLLGYDHPELIPTVPKVLMAFYQIDALEEEVIKQWGTHVSKKYVDKDTSKKVRKAADPFLKWLDEADDDDDEDEE